MKKYLIILVTTLFSLSSCSDILDVSPTNKVTDAAVWEDANLISAYQVELYNCIQHGFRSWNDWLSKGTDETYPSITWGPSMYQAGTMTPDNIGSLDYWNTGYQYIRKINVFIDKMDASNLDLPNKGRWVAEAKFLKAWIYFQLIIRYGGVPLVDEYWSIDEGTSVTFTRNTLEECITEIEKLIADAIPGLPQSYTTTNANFGRATQDVCRALLSRMYLYMASPLFNPTNDRAKWQKAADAALGFMTKAGDTYELYADYGEGFRLISGSQNKEYIFARNFTSTNGHDAPMDNLGRRWGAYGGWFASNGPSQNLVDDYDMKSTGLPPFKWVNGEKVINAASGYDAQNPYKDRDPRLAATVIYDGSDYRGITHEMWIATDESSWGYDSYKQSGDNPRTNYILRKFMPELDQDISWEVKCVVPWPFFRLAEIYLNYAEAMFELGDEDVCREYMNKVRDRVDMPDIPSTVGGEELRERLYNERRVEFAFESHRIFDVRRWKVAMVTENRDIYGMDIYKDITTGIKKYTPVKLYEKKGNFNERMYLIPVSNDEIRKNGGTLEQTSTWIGY
ncbi:RagB/SusD family nutrient uptake outer membrane protein [Bacteroides sp. 51]|uniref:RagB/SusD family nutrient uptake outer membrane protein n=1 Tax=Bacteroides sp. 51 TaxID=2302938 RepID=UPI0013D844A0|nr:RagB/SusD family nutrient uptake outer membrane protein [Bacteroides sp. 51]NDV81600.1 RagB/SusD family nutrient uptake outer membrane protein [Bacteroides sp. 51]